MKTDLQIKREALIYTKESIARVLGVTVNRIGRMWVWAIGFWIWIKGRRPRLYKKSLFEMDFVNFRRNGSKGYTVQILANPYKNAPTEYYVKSTSDPDRAYRVTDTTTKDGASRLMLCQCEDYKKMAEAYKAPVCKHGYALLNHLGYQSLKEANIAYNKHYGYTAKELDARSALGI